MRPKSSAIWRYFSEIDADTVRCNVCNLPYSRKGRGTSGLRSHLQSRHKEEFEEYEKRNTEDKQSQIEKRKNTEETPLQAAKKQLTLQVCTDDGRHRLFCFCVSESAFVSSSVRFQ